MYKLCFRSNLLFLGLAILVTLGLIAFVAKCYPYCVFSPPIWLFAGIQLIIALVGCYLIASHVPKYDLYRVAATIFAFSMLYSAMANLYGAKVRDWPDSELLINYLQLAMMDLGALLSALALYKVEPLYTQVQIPKEVRTSGTSPRVQTQSQKDLQPGTSDAPKAAPSMLVQARSSEFNKMPQQTTGPSPAASGNKLPSQKSSDPFQALESASAPSQSSQTSTTGGHSRSSSHRSSSTYTKLQALSASGTGKSVPSPVEQAADAQSESLKHILDRLDVASDSKPVVTSTSSSSLPRANKPVVPPANQPVPTPQASAPAQKVENEFDNIFANIAPANSQRERQADKTEILPSSAKQSDSLFQPATVNQEIDDLFSALAPAESQREVSSTESTPASTTQPKPAQPTAPPIVIPATPAPATPTPAQSAPAAPTTPAKPNPSSGPQPGLKEFGRLSSKSSVESPSPSGASGMMKTIGKLLNEAPAIEKIIQAEHQKEKLGLSTARVVSAARGEGIKSLLQSFGGVSGISGSIIVGHDGLVIASTVTDEMDKDMLGALSIALHSTSNLATNKLEIGKLKQMVLMTNNKLTILTDVEGGVLAVFSDSSELKAIPGLLSIIEKTIQG